MSDNDITVLKDTLSQHKYRFTETRVAVFKLLQNPNPQSTSEIITRAAGSIDRVTIYRTLDAFEKIGIVHRIYVGWKYKLELSDSFISHHHHLSCLSCGTVIDIDDEMHLEEFIQRLTTTHGFTPRRHQFEIDGYCSSCSNT